MGIDDKDAMTTVEIRPGAVEQAVRVFDHVRDRSGHETGTAFASLIAEAKKGDWTTDEIEEAVNRMEVTLGGNLESRLLRRNKNNRIW